MNRFSHRIVLAVLALTVTCLFGNRASADQSVSKAAFGKTTEGTPVDLYTLVNANGMKAAITNYGAILVSLETPDRDGKMADVVLGYETVKEYIAETPYFGAIVGRYGNRIAKGKFSLDGRQYTLATNNDENHLHGGVKGFDKVVWQAKAILADKGPGLVLNYVSPDGEEGYPGDLSVTITYLLTDDNELRIHYEATTDKPTVCNITHHSYFNLAGQGNGDILGHELMIAAERFTPVDKGLIPTGQLRPVKGTPMDFTKPTAIGDRVNAKDEQIEFGGGYDHNWVLNSNDGSMAIAARVYEPTSGRVMEVLTVEPGLQFYCGNFLDGTLTGKGGKVYKHRYGFCLETQHFPDSPNQPKFPSTTLRPGEKYCTTTVYKFTARK